ncbi:hypothetical protein GGF50DRAFT_116048 [Schizophyllum commune]
MYMHYRQVSVVHYRQWHQPQGLRPHVWRKVVPALDRRPHLRSTTRPLLHPTVRPLLHPTVRPLLRLEPATHLSLPSSRLARRSYVQRAGSAFSAPVVLNDWDIAARHPHPDDSLTPRPSTVFTPRPSTVLNAFTAIEVLRSFTTADVLRPFTTADVLRVSIAADDDVRASTTADVPRASTTTEPCSPNAGADHLFHHDRPAPVYHPDHLVPVYNHDLEALICIFVWVVCCRGGGLVDCHDGQPRLNPLVRGDSHESLASVRECLESKESFLSPITRWNGCKPAAEWGTPIPLRELLFAMPAQPSTIWTAASATWEISGPATTPADELDGRDGTGLPELTVTPSALALCMLSYATGRIGERDPNLARPMSQSCAEDRLERQRSSVKVSEGGSRKVYAQAAPKDYSRAARKYDALGKAFANDPGKALADDPGKALADDPGKAWNDYKEMISKCVMAQDDGFRGMLNDGLRGVLNDWDLAVDPSDLHAHTASTTPSMPSGTTPLMPFGTPPFMAVDMLEDGALKGKVERLYRHDLESLFYVLTWAAYCYADGRRCYEDGWRCYEDGRRCYEDGRRCYEDGRRCYEDGRRCYEDGRRCCNDARRLDPLPEMFERWALGGFSIRPRDFMTYEDPYPLQTCRNSKSAFISGGYQWPRDILPTGEPEDIPWREAGYIAEGLRFFFMEDEAARRAVRIVSSCDTSSRRMRGARRFYRRVVVRQAASDRHPLLRSVAILSMDASPRAVLNDWDLASDASPPSATDTRPPSHVAGLLPSPPSITFAAIDILHDAFTGVVGHLYRLRDLEHLYRHDLEAFIWVFIWVACCIEDGTSSRCVEDGTSPRCVEDARRLDPLPELFRDWVRGDVKRCQGGKLRLLHFGFKAVGPTSTWAAGPALT